LPVLGIFLSRTGGSVQELIAVLNCTKGGEWLIRVPGAAC